MQPDRDTLSPEEQMEGVPLFPAGWRYFKQWRSLRWYLVLLSPALVSAGAYAVRHRGVSWAGAFSGAFVVTLLGATCWACAFVALCSGWTSSNWGTFSRQREPVRYWIDVLILLAVYAGISVAGWFMN